MGGLARWWTWAAVVLIGALALSGCSECERDVVVDRVVATAAPTVTGADVVAAAVSAAEQPMAWQLSSVPSITVGTGVQGKRVAVITKDINPFIQAIKDGISASAGKAGMTVLGSNPAGSAADVARQISQAISQHASAVITVGFTTAEIAAPLQQAHSAGIPVVQLFVTDPGAPPASAANSGVFAYVSPCYACSTRPIATTFPAAGRTRCSSVRPMSASPLWKQTALSQKCANTAPAAPPRSPTRPSRSGARRSPALPPPRRPTRRVNYIVPVFDTASPLIVPALTAANATGRVKLVSSNGDQAQLQDMKAASMPRWVGDIGVNGEWIGWATMDEVFRALTNHPALADEKIGFRAFTPTNIGSLDLTQNPSTWYGGTDFAANYLKLWGLS